MLDLLYLISHSCYNFIISLQPDEITSIDSYTFYSCSGFNGKLKLSKNLKKIGYSAFEGCRSLKGDLTIPDGLETINAWAFSSCTSLDGKLTIPDSVTEFEGSAFAFCNSLTGNPVIPEGSTKIGVRLYDGCSSLTGTLKIPNGVTIIEGYAFHACSGLTGNIKIPKGVKSIGERAFSECSGFTGDLVLPNGIETLGEYAFEKCSNLSGKVYIPKSVTEISYYTFYKMSNLCIYGIKGSYAETFANYFKIPFIAVDESVWDEPVEPESGSETESSSEQESGSELESFSEAESESEPESSSEPESGSEPESSSEAESESEPESVDENEILPEDMPEGGISAVPKDVWVVGVSNEGYSYTGKAIQPKVRVYDYTKRLMVGKDYTVTYKNNTNANSSAGSKTVPSVVVKTKGNYEGTKTVPFQISAIDLNSTDITADDIVVAYNNKVQKKVPILTFNGKKLANNKDFNVSYPSTGQGAYQEEGTYEILVTAKSNGNYTGTRTIKLVIEKKELISKATVKKIADQPYTGSVIIPSIQVSYKNKVLSEGTDYTLNYNNNVEIGTATVNISGIGDYAGTKKVTFKITGQSLKNAKVKGFSNVVYNGNEQTPKPQVEVNGATLKENEDYKVEYQKNVNAGKATLIITGMNAYTGTKKVTFNILAYDLGQDTDKSLTGWSNSIIAKYTKGGSQPKIKIQFKGKELVEGQDYTISYKNNKSVTSAQTKNQPTVTIKGKGNFKGSLTKSFVITQKDLNDSEQSVTMIVADVAFVDKAGKYISKPILTDVDGKKLVVGTDYEKNIEYKLEDGTVLNKDNKVEIGKKITVTVTGKGAYAGTKSVTYLITKSDFNKAKISISSKAYTGKAVVLGEKDIMVKIGNETLKYGEDYEIVPGSYTNNIKKGTASVTIKGKGNYGGLKQAKFKITAKRF